MRSEYLGFRQELGKRRARQVLECLQKGGALEEWDDEGEGVLEEEQELRVLHLRYEEGKDTTYWSYHNLWACSSTNMLCRYSSCRMSGIRLPCYSLMPCTLMLKLGCVVRS